MKRTLASAAVAAGLILGSAGTGSAYGPPPQAPAAGPNGTSFMHGDSASSSTTLEPGPGVGRISARFTELASACPTILAGEDSYPVAMCTAIRDRTPTVHLLDPATGASLASLALPTGGANVFGGIYAYLDNQGRVVVPPLGPSATSVVGLTPTAVATDHALYLLRADAGGRPFIVWRAPYDRGPARKPGQLGHGTGTTPVFFGPHDGTRYVAMVDNAAPREHLLVYRTDGGRAARSRC